MFPTKMSGTYPKYKQIEGSVLKISGEVKRKMENKFENGVFIEAYYESGCIHFELDQLLEIINVDKKVFMDRLNKTKKQFSIDTIERAYTYLGDKMYINAWICRIRMGELLEPLRNFFWGKSR